MTTRQAIVVVARREISSRLRERSFLVSTFVTIALLAAAGVLPALLGDDGPRRLTVVAVGQDAQRVASVARAAGTGVEIDLVVRRAGDEQTARADVTAERADAALTGTPPRIVVARQVDEELGGLVQDAAARVQRERALEEAGLDADQRGAVLQPPALAVEALDPEAADESERQALASIVVLLLYGMLLIYGYWIAAGVVEEKASRVVEVLLSAVKPRALLLGKLLGIGVLGFAQLLLVAGVGAAVVVATGSLDVPAGALEALAVVLAFFILGYALYAAMYAVAGAIVPRQEELQSSTMPLTVIVLASFFAAFTAVGEPEGTLARVLTFVPPCTPMVLPVRLLAGQVPAWQVAVAVALVLVCAVGLVAAAIRIYTNAVLRTGGRVRLVDAWRAR